MNNSLNPTEVSDSIPISISEPIRANILIVDDVPNNLRLLSNMLTGQGYEVRSAISGPMAIKSVQAALPDVILMDINMPEMNGYEVCEYLKAHEQTADIPVIFLSALSETLDKVKAFSVGGVDYITKPFHIEEVIARVENHLAIRSLQKKLQASEAETRRALAKEKELNRLKSEFVAMVSHDFRTPLTSIQGFSELLCYQDDKLSPPERSRYFEKIGLAVDRMLELVDQVLTIGSLEASEATLKVSLLDLREFCQDLIETLQITTGEQHPIQCHIEGNCHQVWLDEGLLRPILTNLLSNAIKYSPKGGDIQLNLACQSSQVVFVVRDQGIGIPAKDQSHLFEAFHRCSNVGQIKGTGLGLAIVRQCVEAHQGTISVESQVGAGTAFTVTLPLLT